MDRIQEKNFNRYWRGWTFLLHDSAGRVFLVGLIFLFLLLLYSLFSSFFPGGNHSKFISLFLTRLIIGRPGGVYFGYVLELSLWQVVFINMLVDMLAVLLLYPLFILSSQRLIQIKGMQAFLNRSRLKAEKGHIFIKKLGKLGLFLFVLFPLWGTGPVIGSFIGFFMGLSVGINLFIVFGATLCALVLWAFLLTGVHQWALTTFGFQISLTFMVGIFLLVIGICIFRWKRKEGSSCG